MTRAVPLPTETEITAVVEALTREDPSRPPAVLAVAARLGLSNATFWRRFPQLAQTLADTRRVALRDRARTPERPVHELPVAELARLRNDKARLVNEVRVAAAEVQRLTLENQALRTQLEQSSGVIPLHTRGDE
ncbi:hypothetical protein [Microbacterium sp.]|uniref:hypothetical protein n=1 Tax=Microbacterium sp. TaxID=51671 RepID=UPI002D049BB2|nr:hypothetical protein [Microbacterium sp.]HWL76507.1 hypothetical protein [Microbacterium sp.]